MRISWQMTGNGVGGGVGEDVGAGVGTGVGAGVGCIVASGVGASVGAAVVSRCGFIVTMGVGCGVGGAGVGRGVGAAPATTRYVAATFFPAVQLGQNSPSFCVTIIQLPDCTRLGVNAELFATM